MYIDIVVNENNLDKYVSVLICNYNCTTTKFKDEVKCTDRGSITWQLKKLGG